jgi:hypothetical protein
MLGYYIYKKITKKLHAIFEDIYFCLALPTTDLYDCKAAHLYLLGLLTYLLAGILSGRMNMERRVITLTDQYK